MTEDSAGYRVAIKPSAWRASAAVGEWVNANGAVRTFDTKALAREWARECSSRDATVWVQDAVPWDEGPADGYLLARSRQAGSDPDGEPRQATLAGSDRVDRDA